MATDNVVSIPCPRCKKELSGEILPKGTVVTCPACHNKFPFPAISSFGVYKARAEKLGYNVLIAEGSPVVMQIILVQRNLWLKNTAPAWRHFGIRSPVLTALCKTGIH